MNTDLDVTDLLLPIAKRFNRYFRNFIMEMKELLESNEFTGLTFHLSNLDVNVLDPQSFFQIYATIYGGSKKSILLTPTVDGEVAVTFLKDNKLIRKIEKTNYTGFYSDIYSENSFGQIKKFLEEE